MEKQKVPIDHKNAVIRVHGLKKAFDDYKVLQGIDLELYQGENLVVLGRSGTGKSVLIKIISGLLKADSGKVEVLGQDIDKLTAFRPDGEQELVDANAGTAGSAAAAPHRVLVANALVIDLQDRCNLVVHDRSSECFRYIGTSKARSRLQRKRYI